MKFLHLSDLHIGKKVNDYSLLNDQKHILNQIVDAVALEKPDAILVSGDVYDKSVPSAEAVQLLDDFLTKLSEMRQKVFVISGNHDSAERIAFGSEIMKHSGIYLSPVYNGSVEPVVLHDEFGAVNIYMLPFIRPANVRACLGIERPLSYTEAMRVAIENMNVDTSVRNVLMAHQFVTGAERCDSEEVIGGLDNVDADVFDCFDYVALGHLHRPQNVTDKIRYCGTPLKYSISEVNDEKSVSVVELGRKGTLVLREIPLVPLRDWQDLRGKYADLLVKSAATDDFVRITLTDEDEILNAYANLRNIYPNILSFAYDNRRTRAQGAAGSVSQLKHKTPMQLFSEFYKQQNNSDLSEKQIEYVQSIINKIWEGEL